VHLPVPRAATGPDGTIADAQFRDGLAQVLLTIADPAGAHTERT